MQDSLRLRAFPSDAAEPSPLVTPHFSSITSAASLFGSVTLQQHHSPQRQRTATANSDNRADSLHRHSDQRQLSRQNSGCGPARRRPPQSWAQPVSAGSRAAPATEPTEATSSPRAGAPRRAGCSLCVRVPRGRAILSHSAGAPPQAGRGLWREGPAADSSCSQQAGSMRIDGAGGEACSDQTDPQGTANGPRSFPLSRPPSPLLASPSA